MSSCSNEAILCAIPLSMCAVWSDTSRKRSFERASRSFFHNCPVVASEAARTAAGMNFQDFEEIKASLKPTIQLTLFLEIETNFDTADDVRRLPKKPVRSRFPPSELTFPFFIRIPYIADGAFVKSVITEKDGRDCLPIPKIRKLSHKPDQSVRRNRRTGIRLWHRERIAAEFRERETRHRGADQRKWHFEKRASPSF